MKAGSFTTHLQIIYRSHNRRLKSGPMPSGKTPVCSVCSDPSEEGCETRFHWENKSHEIHKVSEVAQRRKVVQQEQANSINVQTGTVFFLLFSLFLKTDGPPPVTPRDKQHGAPAFRFLSGGVCFGKDEQSNVQRGEKDSGGREGGSMR